VNLLVAPNDRFLDTDANIAGIQGSYGNGAAFLPALNGTLSALTPNVDSDFISIRVPVEPLSLGLSTPMTSASGVPQVGANTPGNNFKSGAIALIANCKAAAVFQVTEATPAVTGNLAHAIGGGFNPGNAGTDFQHVFRGDSAVYRLQTNHYYIAPGTRAGTNSMWRLSFPNPANPLIASVAEEVVQGIDRMVVTYGVDKGDRTVNRYVTADAVTAWDGVVAVRIQLLSTTVKDGVTLKPQAASFAGSTVVATDRRLRTQVTEVVTLRNHAP
jgi:type IV pilus assembly protein PilW